MEGNGVVVLQSENEVNDSNAVNLGDKNDVVLLNEGHTEDSTSSSEFDGFKNIEMVCISTKDEERKDYEKNTEDSISSSGFEGFKIDFEGFENIEMVCINTKDEEIKAFENNTEDSTSSNDFKGFKIDFGGFENVEIVCINTKDEEGKDFEKNTEVSTSNNDFQCFKNDFEGFKNFEMVCINTEDEERKDFEKKQCSESVVEIEKTKIQCSESVEEMRESSFSKNNKRKFSELQADCLDNKNKKEADCLDNKNKKEAKTINKENFSKQIVSLIANEGDVKTSSEKHEDFDKLSSLLSENKVGGVKTLSLLSEKNNEDAKKLTSLSRNNEENAIKKSILLPKSGDKQMASSNIAGNMNKNSCKKNQRLGENMMRMNYLFQASRLIQSQKDPKKFCNASSTLGNLSTCIGRKAVLKIDHNLKRQFCKGCGEALIPGLSSTVRLRNNRNKHLVSKCQKCLTIKRFLTEEDYELWPDKIEALEN